MMGFTHTGQDWVWMAVMMTLATVVTIAVVIAIVRSRASSSRPSEPAREALKLRYARGELTAEEYRERLDVLSR